MSYSTISDAKFNLIVAVKKRLFQASDWLESQPRSQKGKALGTRLLESSALVFFLTQFVFCTDLFIAVFLGGE